jgi:hypothetical protein
MKQTAQILRDVVVFHQDEADAALFVTKRIHVIIFDWGYLGNTQSIRTCYTCCCGSK